MDGAAAPSAVVVKRRGDGGVLAGGIAAAYGDGRLRAGSEARRHVGLAHTRWGSLLNYTAQLQLGRAGEETFLKIELLWIRGAFLCCPRASTYRLRLSKSTRRPSGLQILNGPRLGCD